MPKRQIFYSFHYDNDVMRAQQIRNIGVIEGNEPVSTNQWEEVKRKGDSAIKKWIDNNMKNRTCVVVLVGEETADREWIQYEIRKAWEEGKGILGIYIHNINCPRSGKCSKGANPFEQFTFKNGTKMSSIVKCYDPGSRDAYSEIKDNIEKWVEDAIDARG
jgi:hypothetical protein